MTHVQLAHMEATVNVVAGLVIAQGVLFIYDMPFREAVGLNVLFLGVSYVRLFVIRLIFAKVVGK